jgi:Ca2+-binding EF-hand superfamily protein
MRYAILLAALGFASAAGLATAAPEGRAGAMAERLKQADTNHDGMINREEAKALPRILKDFDAIDTNRDGQVTAEELRAYRQSRAGDKGKHHHGGAFLKKLDTDGDGRISKAEAQAAPRLAEHFDALDADHDGFITTEEMKAAHARHERAAK